MFKAATRYVTRGVLATVPIPTQNLLWLLVEHMPNPSKNYLQIFHLHAQDKTQSVTHTQEHPPYRKEHHFTSEEPITAKLYIIDDGTHSTMLLAEDY